MSLSQHAPMHTHARVIAHVCGDCKRNFVCGETRVLTQRVRARQQINGRRPSFRFGGLSAYPVRGHIVAIPGKSTDNIYYDTLVYRQSTYRGIIEEGHSSGRAGENQCDVAHGRAEAKSDALTHGGTPAGVRSPTTLRTLRSLTPIFPTRLAECRLICQNRRPSPAECFQMFMHDFIHGCINVFWVTEY